MQKNMQEYMQWQKNMHENMHENMQENMWARKYARNMQENMQENMANMTESFCCILSETWMCTPHLADAGSLQLERKGQGICCTVTDLEIWWEHTALHGIQTFSTANLFTYTQAVPEVMC
jgi:hypothetical protein